MTPEEIADPMHISLVCRLKRGQPHPPCSGTCDRSIHSDPGSDPGKGLLCHQPCECNCHAGPLVITGTETDVVYRERHHVIAHLAAIYPAVMVLNADQDEPDWPVLFLELPTGQVSWHIAPADMDLFRHVPIGTTQWDGHDVAEKYRRLDEHTKAIAG